MDTGFWSMGISGAALMLSGTFLILVLIRSERFGSGMTGTYVVPAFTFISLLIVQCLRRPFRIPFWDDYYGYYEWFIRKATLKGNWAKTTSFFDTYLECKTAVSRMIAQVCYTIFGTEFIHWMKYLNLLILLGIVAMIAAGIREPVRRKYVFWISGILLFNLQQFYNILCAFSGTTYYLVVFLGLAAFHLHKHETRGAQFAATACAVGAAFTFGNGWIIFPLLACSYLNERKFRRAGAIAVTAFITAVIYFHDYEPKRLNPLGDFNLSEYVLYVFAFNGSHFQFHSWYSLPFLMSTFITFILVLGIKRNNRNQPIPVNLLLLGFLIATGFLAGIFRHQSGFQQSLSLRYGFFSATALAAAIACIMNGQTEKNFLRFKNRILVIAIALTAGKMLFFYPEMAIAQTENHRMIRNWIMKGVEINKRTAFYPEGTTALLASAGEHGFWKHLPEDTERVNSNLFTIGYLSPASKQTDP